MMKRFFYSIIFLGCALYSSPRKNDTINRLTAPSDADFITSFLKHFEFSPEGRYVHEYHSLILQQTSESFRLLENELVKNGFELHGRFAILGYEENSMPQYYTDFKAAKINDEATTKNNAGWSLKLHNRFGFMTGFALKDINPKDKNQDQIFEHINADKIPLFDSRAGIFHEHAFGEALPLMHATYTNVMKVLTKHEYRKILNLLIKFWERLYGGSLKVGNKQVAGTQDILFSIAGAKHLLASPVPLKKYFTGPDITYPIEVFNSQQKEATHHAQTFVKRFVEHLVPRNNKKTVYVFCSFVDGVGKSTMLGNVKNWMKYGNVVERYEHVDNSSSQLADLFKFSDDVFIADLPAQMSHFTFKPDGLVFVDINTEKRFINKIDALKTHIVEHEKTYEKDFQQQLEATKKLVEEHGYFESSIQAMSRPDKAFMRNLVLLKKDSDNYWIPFQYEGEYFLYNRDNTSEIRCLQSLADVKSEGLKNIKSEQMLFFNGIRFPFPYTVFMDDLVTKFKEQDIEEVVFVDFLSMYPRSSRENIRVNYLLQQLALIDQAFDVKESIYHDFVSGGQLLYAMQERETSQKIAQALELETLVRLQLHNLIIERDEGDLTGIDIEALTRYLKEQLTKVTTESKALLSKLVLDKVKKELFVLEKLYGRSKSYVNIQQLSLKRVCLFSRVLQDVFANQIENERIKALWEDIEALATPREKASYGLRDGFITTQKGEQLYECFSCPPGCKDELLLAPMLRFIRASWYASLANLLFSYVGSEGKLVINDEKFLIPACYVKTSPLGEVHVVQKVFEPWTGKIPQQPFDLVSTFNIGSQSAYGLFMDGIYRLDWDNRSTSAGVYCYDYSSEDIIKKTGAIPSIVTKVVNQHQADNGVATIVPAAELCPLLEHNGTWGFQHDMLNKDAQKNGMVAFCNGNYSFGDDHQTDPQKPSAVKKRKKKVMMMNPEQYEGARLFVRLITTLEMFVKDPEANVAVRHMNREDFSEALKMVEDITIPKYFNMLVPHPENLFHNYEEVEPYPSWEFWEQC